MKHLKPIKDRKDPLEDFIPIGKKDCQGMCDREVIMTKDGPVIVCHGCNRIVMDNRNKK
jgi:hypothetical protein